jgi:hypothetical protein
MELYWMDILAFTFFGNGEWMLMCFRETWSSRIKIRKCRRISIGSMDRGPENLRWALVRVVETG